MVFDKMNYQHIHQTKIFNVLVDKLITSQSLSPRSIYSQRKFPVTFYHVKRLVHYKSVFWNLMVIKFFKVNYVLILELSIAYDNDHPSVSQA